MGLSAFCITTARISEKSPIDVPSIDKTRSVIETIKSLEPRPHIFCNGGDQFNDFIPEAEICRELGIKLADGLGGKIQSSSWLIKKSKE